jgi:hypothetical protein
MNHECFGFLGVTLGKYTFSKFFQIKTMQIGILRIDGVFDHEKYLDFIYNSTNKILKSNKDIILLKDKTKFQLTQSPDDTDSNDSDDSSFLSSSVDASLNFENCKFDILTNFLTDFEKSITNLKLKHILQFGLVNINLQARILESIPEYHELEKKKILTVFRIYNSFYDYNLEISTKIQNAKLDFSVLKLSDPFLQKIILEILLLFMLSIFNRDLAYHTLKFILNIETDITDTSNLSDTLKLILECEVVYLLGLYFDLYLHLTQKLLQEKENDLEFNIIFQQINKLSSKNLANSKIFSKTDENSITSRKNFINLNFINFFDKELASFEKIVTITQHVHDFLINKKIDKYLIQYSFYYYRIFLEIRSYFFEYINKSEIEEGRVGVIFNGHTDKEYYNYRIKKLDYDCYFKDTREKQSNLLYKDKKGKLKIKDELKNSLKKIILPKMNQINNKLSKSQCPNGGANTSQINSPSNTHLQTENNSYNISGCQTSPHIGINLKQDRVRNNRGIDLENFNALPNVKSSANIKISLTNDSSKYYLGFNSVFKRSDSLIQIKDKLKNSKKLYNNFKENVPFKKHFNIRKGENFYLTKMQDTNNSGLINTTKLENDILIPRSQIKINFHKKLQVRLNQNNTINTVDINKDIILPNLSKRGTQDEIQKPSFKNQTIMSSKANLLRNASYLKTDPEIDNSSLFITPMGGFLK